METEPNNEHESTSGSQLTQMLGKLAEAGLVYRNGHGRYCFSVPLMGQFIKRQHERA